MDSNTTTAGNAGCIAASSRSPDMILPHHTSRPKTPYSGSKGQGNAPDIIYTRGVPDTPNPDPSTFDRKICNLILMEIGLCGDLCCITRLEEKMTNDAPLVAPLQAI